VRFAEFTAREAQKSERVEKSFSRFRRRIFSFRHAVGVFESVFRWFMRKKLGV
jgi:hypothetical protein